MSSSHVPRRQTIRRRASELGLEALVVASLKNVRYLTGFTGSNAILVVRREGDLFLTDGRYRAQVEEQTTGLEVEITSDPLHKRAAELLRDAEFDAIGVEGDHVTWTQYAEMVSIVGEGKLGNQRGMVEEMRMVKEPWEVETIRRAQTLVDEIYADLLTWLRPGMTEREAAARMHFAMEERGASGPSFETIVASGPRGALPHGVASDKRIERGELVVLDFGAMLDGYASDFTRTVVAGPPDEESKRVHEVVLRAQQAAIDAVRPGMAARDLDGVARAVITEAGMGERFSHSLGHGLGLDIHEEPRLSSKGERVLAEGMVVTIEPGVYIPGWGGVRIEDVVLVRPGGGELLSHSSRELAVLPD